MSGKTQGRLVTAIRADPTVHEVLAEAE